jgi:hypothetical protein
MRRVALIRVPALSDPAKKARTVSASYCGVEKSSRETIASGSLRRQLLPEPVVAIVATKGPKRKGAKKLFE